MIVSAADSDVSRASGPPSIVQHDHLTAVDQTLVALERAWAPPHPADASERFYGLEPLPLPMFLRGMNELGNPQGRSLLDVGCGAGVKLHLARMLGWDRVAGIDRHPPYVAAARDLCPWARIETVDAFAFDDYRDFGVVYMYRPCVADDDEVALERLVVSRMRPGALAFFPQSVAVDLGESVAEFVWRVD